jgi:hypothetical protein
MSILGVAPLGILPLTGSPPSSVSGNATPVQASAIGVAGALNGSNSTSGIGVSAIGVAGVLLSAVALSFSGVTGIGVARAVMPTVSASISEAAASGVGRSQSIVNNLTLAPAVAIGTVNLVSTTSTAPVVFGVSSSAVAGSLIANPAGVSLQAFSSGVAGKVSISISGGGGARRDPRMRTGFEPVKKVYRAPEPPRPEPKIKPPPAALVRAMRPPPIPKPPAPLIDERLIPDIGALIQQIREAESASKRQQQDEADIAELLAFLEAQDEKS